MSIHIDSVSSTSGLALSFTESPMFINPFTSDDSSYPSPNMSYDGVLHLDTPLKRGLWTQPTATLRGGFRYLTIVSTAPGESKISNVSTAISFAPHIENLRDYAGYFYAKDPVFHDEDFLTKVSALRVAKHSPVMFIHPCRSGMRGHTQYRSIQYRSTLGARSPS